MAKNGNSDVTVIDGSLDWSEGVNSDVCTTIQSERNPNGLKRTQVSWMDNATVRGGGITQRTGWNGLGAFPVVAGYQGQFLYFPTGANPYLIIVLGGHVFKADVDDPAAAVDLSVQFHISMPSHMPSQHGGSWRSKVEMTSKFSGRMHLCAMPTGVTKGSAVCSRRLSK